MLDRRMLEIDMAPDLDGRFRVNEFFCYDNVWRQTFLRLAKSSSAVLMDLRGFSRAHAGLCFELEALVHFVPLSRVRLVVDEQTDRQYLGEVLAQAWRVCPPQSPNCRNGSLPIGVTKFSGRSSDYRELYGALATAVSRRGNRVH